MFKQTYRKTGFLNQLRVKNLESSLFTLLYMKLGLLNG